MLMHTHTISFNYPPITNDCLYPAPQYILWNCCVYPRGRDVLLRNTLPCTVYEVLEYMSVLHETFVTRLTHYPVCPLPGSSGTRHVRITHPARQPGTSGFRYAPSSKRPCSVCVNSETWSRSLLSASQRLFCVYGLRLCSSLQTNSRVWLILHNKLHLTFYLI